MLIFKLQNFKICGVMRLQGNIRLTFGDGTFTTQVTEKCGSKAVALAEPTGAAAAPRI